MLTEIMHGRRVFQLCIQKTGSEKCARFQPSQAQKIFLKRDFKFNDMTGLILQRKDLDLVKLVATPQEISKGEAIEGFTEAPNEGISVQMFSLQRLEFPFKSTFPGKNIGLFGVVRIADSLIHGNCRISGEYPGEEVIESYVVNSMIEPGVSIKACGITSSMIGGGNTYDASGEEKDAFSVLKASIINNSRLEGRFNLFGGTTIRGLTLRNNALLQKILEGEILDSDRLRQAQAVLDLKQIECLPFPILH